MSIIHDALKKVERERELLPLGAPPYRGQRVAHRRRTAGVTVGMLISLTSVGAVSAWLWLQGLAGGLTFIVTPPMLQNSPRSALEEAEPVARQVGIAAPPSDARPLEALAPSQSDDAPFPTALHGFAFETPATAEAAFERARGAESRGLWQQAIHYYRQALALNPGLIEAHNNLGNLYIREQRVAAAIGEFQAALAHDPQYAIARNNLGSAYVMLGEEGL
ncbi:MAG TPA: tetratricopeptide repeat protein, partial [Candidatus Tectomicrobia bacterium]|nr:tetratricopeptide repeat protein [Candidatus Tectomicrobia bacterium]